ncbi:sigma factor [Caulobacter endophyticus]|nr:sigma factor [Caulobacter endophyticus]MDG2531573.1 sigma factor [Caulobacter endophyticus]
MTSSDDTSRDRAFKAELVEVLPRLRAFARSLAGDAHAADDLVQDTLLKAWNARESYVVGTNMKAWAFMILRNQFYHQILAGVAQSRSKLAIHVVVDRPRQQDARPGESGRREGETIVGHGGIGVAHAGSSFRVCRKGCLADGGLTLSATHRAGQSLVRALALAAIHRASRFLCLGYG